MSQYRKRPPRPALPEADRVRIRELVNRHGESGASAILGIERNTIARALAALPLYPGTFALVKQKLSELEGSAL